MMKESLNYSLKSPSESFPDTFLTVASLSGVYKPHLVWTKSLERNRKPLTL